MLFPFQTTHTTLFNSLQNYLQPRTNSVDKKFSKPHLRNEIWNHLKLNTSYHHPLSILYCINSILWLPFFFSFTFCKMKCNNLCQNTVKTPYFFQLNELLYLLQLKIKFPNDWDLMSDYTESIQKILLLYHDFQNILSNNVLWKIYHDN